MNDDKSYFNNLWHKVEQIENMEKRELIIKKQEKQKITKFFVFFLMSLSILVIPSLLVEGLMSFMIYIINFFILINAVYLERVIFKH